MYDLKNWFLMPLASAGYKYNNAGVMTGYGRDSHHLEGLNLTNNSKVYAYHSDTGKTMIFSKAPQKDANGKLTLGWPWDLKSYDDKLIYDWATELDWTSPRDYKMMNTPIPMCPRYWNGDPSIYQFSQHAAYGQFQNCKQTGKGDVGPVYYSLQGPFLMDFGGNVATAQTILLTYYWDDRKDREQLFLTSTAGWVRWTHANLTQLPGSVYSDYIIDAEVVHDMIVPGVVTASFPCMLIP